jgi:membrane-associated protease RseP (regulator of RpoE activity)
MTHRFLLGGLAAGLLFALTGTPRASAQAVVPGAPLPKLPIIQFPKINGLPDDLQKQVEELQRQLEKQMDPNFLQQELNRGVLQGSGSTIKWGGLRVKKVNTALQEQLGLPENEGVVVTAVDPNSLAEKAGLKVSDVLVKVNNKAVPSHLGDFAKLVKEQNPGDAMDLVVLRKGKEETIKGVKMPVTAQANPSYNPGFGGRGGVGGVGNLGILQLRIAQQQARLQQGMPMVPLLPMQQQGSVQNLHLEMIINGAKVTRKQTGTTFSGDYALDELKIHVQGTIANGQPRIGEITVQQGNDSRKYTTLAEVPFQQRAVIQQMLLPSSGNQLIFPQPGLPMLPNIPGFPQIPGLDDA